MLALKISLDDLRRIDYRGQEQGRTPVSRLEVVYGRDDSHLNWGCSGEK